MYIAMPHLVLFIHHLRLIDKIMEKTFISIRSVRDLAISSSIILIGAILVVLPTSTPVNITGFFLLFAGLILALVLKSGYKDVETGERFQKKEHYFQQAMHTSIASALETKPESIDLTEADKGNAVKLDIYYSRSSGKVYGVERKRFTASATFLYIKIQFGFERRITET